MSYLRFYLTEPASLTPVHPNALPAYTYTHDLRFYLIKTPVAPYVQPH